MNEFSVEIIKALYEILSFIVEKIFLLNKYFVNLTYLLAVKSFDLNY